MTRSKFVKILIIFIFSMVIVMSIFFKDTADTKKFKELLKGTNEIMIYTNDSFKPVSITNQKEIKVFIDKVSLSSQKVERAKYNCGISFRKTNEHIFLNVNTALGYFTIDSPNPNKKYYKLSSNMQDELGKYINMNELNAK